MKLSSLGCVAVFALCAAGCSRSSDPPVVRIEDVRIAYPPVGTSIPSKVSPSVSECGLAFIEYRCRIGEGGAFEACRLFESEESPECMPAENASTFEVLKAEPLLKDGRPSAGATVRIIVEEDRKGTRPSWSPDQQAAQLPEQGS